jgi:hypothetical protein
MNKGNNNPLNSDIIVPRIVESMKLCVDEYSHQKYIAHNCEQKKYITSNTLDMFNNLSINKFYKFKLILNQLLILILLLYEVH